MSISSLRPSLRWLRIYSVFGLIPYSLRTKALRTFYLIKLSFINKVNSIIKGLNIISLIGL